MVERRSLSIPMGMRTGAFLAMGYPEIQPTLQSALLGPKGSPSDGMVERCNQILGVQLAIFTEQHQRD
ncbi:unnamed protein product [Lepidochelys kempii]